MHNHWFCELAHTFFPIRGLFIVNTTGIKMTATKNEKRYMREWEQELESNGKECGERKKNCDFVWEKEEFHCME